MVLPFRKVGAQRIDPTSIEVAYRHEQGFFGFRDHSAQTWSFDAQALPVGAGDNVAPVAVARGEALTVRLHGERNPYDALDEHSEGARRVGEAIFDVSSGELLSDFERLIEGLGDRVLVVTELEVEAEWRGHGLDPLIGGLAIDALSGGAVAVLCWPAPLHRQLGGDGTERDLTDDERDGCRREARAHVGPTRVRAVPRRRALRRHCRSRLPAGPRSGSPETVGPDW